ncbi:MAG: peptidoglycan recognition family protein [Planctomycetota bacterium]
MAPGPERVTPQRAAPRWSGQPHSWGKLDEIERWLDGADAASAAPYWTVEARLQLAEGRLAFAGADRENTTDPRTLAYRRGSARSGFDSVLARPGSATPDQLARARAGARAVSGLGDPERVPAAASSSVPVSGLVRRAQWRAAPLDARNVRRATARWNWITVHHSALEVGSNALADSLESVRGIQRAHQRGNGWADIGYHFLIDGAGRVIEGRSLRWQGAHAGGEAENRGNVGICLLGNFDVEEPTQAAVRSLERLVAELQHELRIPRRNVKPHRHWKETECPGRHLMPWFARF